MLELIYKCNIKNNKKFIIMLTFLSRIIILNIAIINRIN